MVVNHLLTGMIQVVQLMVQCYSLVSFLMFQILWFEGRAILPYFQLHTFTLKYEDALKRQYFCIDVSPEKHHIEHETKQKAGRLISFKW